MAVIGRAVMRQLTLAQIVGERRHEVEGPPRWVFSTTNPLLGRYPGVDGIKTGFDDLAGRCLVATAVRDGRRAVAVVMNSANTADDAASLLDFAFADDGWARRPAPSPRLGVTAIRLGTLRADLDRADDAPTTVAAAAMWMTSARASARWRGAP
jgi:hypothetical protein